MNTLTALLSHPAIWRGNQLGHAATPSVPTGFAALDAELPGGGWPTAALTEILPQHDGIGELRILGHALANLSAHGRWLAWIAPPYLPYAPALQAAGIDLAKLLFIKTRSPRETLWAIEQALRSKACGAVLAWPDNITFPELRRLQLAAESNPGLAVLFRATRRAGDSTPAALRLSLQTCAGGLAVRILKRRGALLGNLLLLRPPPVVNRNKSGLNLEKSDRKGAKTPSNAEEFYELPTRPQAEPSVLRNALTSRTFAPSRLCG